MSFEENLNGFHAMNIDGRLVNEVFTKYKEKADMDFHSRMYAINVAKVYIGAFKPWLGAMLNGEYLYGRRLDFIIDTLSFIETGRRTISISNWNDLLMEEVLPNKLLITQETRNKVANTGLNLDSFSQIISRWCRQVNGFDDMLCTLNILFGDYRSTSEPVKTENSEFVTSNMLTNVSN